MVMSRVVEKVAELAQELGVEWEVQDRGVVPRKGERIVKAFPHPAFGLIDWNAWEGEKPLPPWLKNKAEWIAVLKKYDFDKLVYRTATRWGRSVLYLVKYSQ